MFFPDAGDSDVDDDDDDNDAGILVLICIVRKRQIISIYHHVHAANLQQLQRLQSHICSCVYK